ncbi:MAG: hypothetical protein Q8L87_10105 [Anaerolineales bacterium]|nr:hypothetical protein [Anaerolineales bacterium]
MSKRKRQSVKPTAVPQIEWLKYRTGYPSLEEREEIVNMRKELSMELILLMSMGAEPNDPRMRALGKKYGREEFERALIVLTESLRMSSRVADDATSYRDYRRRYARFGAGLKFYTMQEMDDMYADMRFQFKNALENNLEGIPSFDESLSQNLLADWNSWKDITPPAVPPRPADYAAPAPASYPAPINELLEWGDDLKKSLDFLSEVEHKQWEKHVPALTRMALDPGLLNGWPSEAASWAPWHAIHALGYLQAWESAPALAQLADLENDWLSDHLAHIWADMGWEVEPSLWAILENATASAKQRGLAAEGLQMMTDENEAMEDRVINGFEKILENTNTFNPMLNAYLIHFLNEMEAADEVMETIDTAFEEGRVDLDIITPEDLYDDEFDDDENED